MKKKGIGISMEVVVVATLALLILIVLIAIYRGYIGKTSHEIKGIGEEVSKEANDATWCISTFTRGIECWLDVDSCDQAGCEVANIKTMDNKCKLNCHSTEGKVHKIAMKNLDRSYNCEKNDRAERYCCCP